MKKLCLFLILSITLSSISFAKYTKNGFGCPQRGINGLWGYSSYIRGVKDIPCIYKDAECFTDDGTALVMNEKGYYGIIVDNGKILIPCKYRSTAYYGFFNEGMISVMNDDSLWGFCDYKGKEVIPCKYNIGDDDYFIDFRFYEGYALVPVDSNTYMFIDKTGKQMWGLTFKSGRHFSEGYAAVEVDTNTWMFIDKTGKQMWGLTFKDIIDDFSWGNQGCYARVGIRTEDGYHIYDVNTRGELFFRR
ncbi:MAG: WG repeat-containing protein [Ignavibacteria bacterium]|jgi:hypothetical protein|nr:WG repeat-containing protein [Ignavibacteria bacterium]